MTWTGLMLTAGLALAAQPPGAPPAEAARLTVPPVDLAAERAEDVEVMRRILNKAVGLPNEPITITATYHSGPGGLPHGFYPGQTTNNTTSGLPYGYGTTLNYPSSTLPAARLADPFDGVYLKGHGVVYTLKIKSGEQYSVQELRRHAGLATGCTLCHVGVPVPAEKLEPAAPSRAEVTEWDRTRNALRGVKEPATADPAPTVEPKDVCRPGKLTYALITALMKNGRHIRHVAPAEAVTLVVTLDGLYGPSRAVAATDPNQAVVDFLSGDVFAPASPTADPASRPTAPAGQPEPNPFGFTADESKQLALGDLHMKQNNPKGAVPVYEKALARVGLGAVTVPGDMLKRFEQRFPAVLEETKRSVAEARRKLAYALLAAGNAERAKKALDASFDVRIEPGTAAPGRATTGTAGTAAPAVPVPAKLVLTVKKADLDRADKLTPAEFKKLVAVETVGLPPADKVKK